MDYRVIEKAPEKLLECIERRNVRQELNKLLIVDEIRVERDITRIINIRLNPRSPFWKIPSGAARYLVKLALLKKKEDLVALYMSVKRYKLPAVLRRVLECVKKTVAPEARRIEFRHIDSGERKLAVLDREGNILYVVEDPVLLDIYLQPEILENKINRALDDLFEDYKIILGQKWTMERKMGFEKWKREIFEYAGIEC